MTITRLFYCIALLATLGACGWTRDAHAQRTPAEASSVAAAPKTQAVAPAHAAPQERARPSSKTVSTSHVQATVAVNTKVAVDKEQGRYQSRPHGYMEPYRNAVTPPVDSGR
jgi:hypothetical protein